MLSWEHALGATGYQIEIRKPSEGTFTKVYEGSDLAFEVTGLDEKTEYFFRLRSVCGDESASVWSEVISISVEMPFPATFTVETKTWNAVNLAWSPVPAWFKDKVTYSISIKEVGNKSGFREVYRGSDTCFTSKDLCLNTEYAFCLRTFCRGFYSERSATILSKTNKIFPPSNAKVKAVSWNSVRLSWDSELDEITYKIKNYGTWAHQH